MFFVYSPIYLIIVEKGVKVRNEGLGSKRILDLQLISFFNSYIKLVL